MIGRVGDSMLFVYLALLSYAPETVEYLIDASTANNVVNATKNYLHDKSTLISSLQQQMGKHFEKDFKGNQVEDDGDVHTEEDSSEEDDDEEKEEQVNPTGRDLSKDTVGGANRNLSPDLVDSVEPQNNAISVIDNSFISKKTFSCPKIKNDFVTGTDTGNLSPEDIGIIAAMGDSLATGRGLWPQTDVEFRGAAFPIGGDATIDGLVTIANILREFNDKLIGVSHGMGTKFQLPYHQLNVAESGASSSSMPLQANELIKRLKALREVDVNNKWTMVIITIGTEEICKVCEAPDYNALLESLLILNQGIQNALVILVGPIHVSFSHQREANLLKSRCDCSKKKSTEFMKKLNVEWTKAFAQLEAHFQHPPVKRRKFGLLALPMLTITSRHPSSLFISNPPLLNRKGHSYATKWLWNRLMTGPTYNLSLAALSQDSYYCPSMRCPYFRTPANLHYCRLIRHVDVENQNEEIVLGVGKPMRRSRQKLYATAASVVVICLLTVLLVGTILYQKSKYKKRTKYRKNLYTTKEGAFELLTTKN